MTAIDHAVLDQPLDSLFLTDAAIAKIQDLIAKQQNPKLNLRVYVEGGGCSGFQYGFNFDELVNPDDTTITRNGVNLVVDADSLPFLQGAQVDFIDDLSGAQFVISNPNAKTSCGCGSSFTPDI